MDNQEIKTDVGTVSIEMAAEEINAANKVDEPQVSEGSPSNPQSDQPQNTELSTSNSQEIVVEKTDPINGGNTETMRFEIKPQRNEKGQFIEGNQESKGLTNSGRPCEFCERPVEILNKINLYREYCRGNVDGKQHIPYIQELVSEDYLDITMSQLEDWRASKKHEEQHSELNRTLFKLMNRQQLLLLKATLSDRYRGAIFQLSANHGMYEKSKQYQAGDPNEPLEYNIHIVPKTNKQIEQQDE